MLAHFTIIFIQMIHLTKNEVKFIDGLQEEFDLKICLKNKRIFRNTFGSEIDLLKTNQVLQPHILKFVSLSY